MFRQALKLSGISLLALLILLILIASPPRILETAIQPVRALLVSATTAVISRSLNGTIEIGAIEGSLLSAPVIRDFRLKDTQGEQLIHIEHLSLRNELTALFRGQWQIHDLVITGPQLRLAWDQQGQLNLLNLLSPAPLQPATPSADADALIPITLQHVMIRNGTVELRHPTLSGVREINDITLDLSAEAGEDGFNLKLQHGFAHTKPAGIRLEIQQGALAVAAGLIHLEPLHLKTNTSQISLMGTIPTDSLPSRLELELSPLDMGEIGLLLSDSTLKGKVHGILQAEGPAEALELEGELTAGPGKILLTGLMDTQGPVPAYWSTLQLIKFDLSELLSQDAFRSELNATLQIQGTGLSPSELDSELELLIGPSQIGEMEIQPSEVRLTAGSELLRVEHFQLQTTAFNAVLEGEIDLNGESALEYQVAVELERLRDLTGENTLSGKAQLKGQVAGSWPNTFINGNLEASGIHLNDMEVQTLKLDYRVDNLVSEPALAAQLDIRSAQIGGIGIEKVAVNTTYAFDDSNHQGEFSARLVHSVAMEAQLNGSIASDGERSELTLEHFNSRIEDHLWNNTTPLRVTLTPDSLLIEPFRLIHDDELLALSGRIQDGQFHDLVLSANNIDLTFLARIAAIPTLFPGRGDFLLDLQGPLENPVIKADVSVRTDQEQNPPFEQSDLQLSYAHKRLQGEAYIEQDNRRVLSAKLALPVDLAFKPLSLAQRLLATPLSANLNIDRPQLERLSPSLTDTPLAGTLQGQIELTGTYADLAIDSRIDVEGFALPNTELDFSARLDEERFQFVHLSAVTDASEINLKGDISLDEQHLALQCQIPHLELREFIAEFPDQVPSSVSGRMDLAGTLQDPILNSRLEYAGARLTTDIKLGLREPTPEYQVDLRINELGLARFITDQQGDLEASMSIRGVGFSEDDRKASINVSIDSEDLTLAPELNGQLQASIFGRSLDVASLELHSIPIQIQAQGVVSDTQTSDFNYRLSVKDLNSLQGYIPGALTVQAELTGKIAGDQGVLHNLNNLDVTEWRYADWQGNEVQAELKIENLLADRQLTAKADISGLQSPHLASTTLQLDLSYLSDRGKFSLIATEGPLAQSLIAGQIQTDNGVQVRITPFHLQHSDWAWDNTDPIQLAMDKTGTITVEDFSLTSLEQRINIRGLWSPGGTVAAEAQVNGLQIKPVADALNLGIDELDGMIDADVQIAGTQAQPQLEAALQATALSWQEQDLGEINAQLATAGALWSGKAHWLDQQQTILSLEGRLDRSKSDALDVDLFADNFDLSLLQSLSPEILESDGRLHLDLKFNGSLTQPQAWGTLDLQDGQLRLASLGEAYTDIQSRLVFDNTRVNVDQLQVKSTTGVINLNGWLEASDWSQGKVDLTLNADQFTLVQTPALSAVVNSAMTLRGTNEDLLVSGEMEVVQARLRYGALPSSGPATVEPWELTVEGVFGAGEQATTDVIDEQSRRGSTDPLPYLRTDVRVKLPSNSWVQGNGTAVEIVGDIRVKKTLKRPFTVAGELRALRGFATLFGRRFTVERGEINFTGSEEIDPILDIEASHRVSGYMVYANITGNSSKPEISFRSDPELGESDVLSLLVFGTTSDQLSASEQVSLGNQARNLAGQFAASMLERTLGDTLGLDAITIETGDETTSSSVGAGRYIGQGLFLFYERTFRDSTRGNRSGNTVGIEKRLNPRQTLKATGSDLGETSIDWLWEYDY